MLLPDVNVLVYAHRTDAREHGAHAQWLRDLADGTEPFAMSELVLEAFLRLATNPRVFRDPTPTPAALAFLDQLVARPGCRLVRPGPRHWNILRALCESTRARGAFIADLQHAAVAIEHGCEWVSGDGDFARVPGLRWRHPLARG